MCFYCRCEKVAQSKNGHILRDWEKKNLAIQFGNVDILMSKKQFTSFSKFLNKLCDKHLMEMTNTWTNKVTLKQREFMGGYSFDRDEFEEIRDLINEVVGHLMVEDELKKILNR